MRLLYRYKRIQRLLWPFRYDRTSYLLIHACGAWWLFLTGWRREYEVAGFVIDLAHPWLKLALEADGERFHMDIVRETERDSALSFQGYSVRHYRYPAIKNQPDRVRKEVRRWFWKALIIGLKR